MRVSDAMTRDVRLANPGQTIRDAARMMEEMDAGAMPVGEGDRLVGMITDRDIAIRAVAQGKGPDTPVREVMSTDIKYCYEDEGRDNEPRAVEPCEHRSEHDSPHATPEGERPEERHAEGLGRRERKWCTPAELGRVEQRERALVEKEHGDEPGDEADDEPARKLRSCRVVVQRMSVHEPWTGTVAVRFITMAQACGLQVRRC